MKKRFLLVFFMTILIGCTNNNDSLVANDQSFENEQQQIQVDFPLIEGEAFEIAKELIYNINYVYNNQWEFEGENPPDEVVKERLEKIKNYTTEQLYKLHYTFDLIYCGTPYCLTPLPIELSYGIRHEVIVIDENHFQITGLFPGLSDEDPVSFRQSVDVVLDNRSWKVSDFTKQPEDMNILPEEIESYLVAYSMSPIDIQDGGTVDVDGISEAVYTFKDGYFEEPYEVVLRTGEIRYVGDNVETYERFSNEFSEFLDIAYELEDDDLLYELLFTYVGHENINSSAPEIKQFLQRSATLQAQLMPVYDEVRREELTELHQQYNILLSDVSNYYKQFYRDEPSNELSFYFRSWENVRKLYFEKFNVNTFKLNEADIQFLEDDTFIIRNQILRLMTHESAKQSN